MREISVAEQRYRAVLAVVADGRTVTEVADGDCAAPIPSGPDGPQTKWTLSRAVLVPSPDGVGLSRFFWRHSPGG